MEIKDTLLLLNTYLGKKKIKRSFIICGGASLALQGIISRTTKDIDVVAPPIDEALQEAALHVSKDLGLDDHWLNTGASSLSKELKLGWENRVHEVFKASNLIVYSISREDLIFSKFWALCDRKKDKSDLLLLQPTKVELEDAVRQTITCDGNPEWPEWVKKQANMIRKELKFD